MNDISTHYNSTCITPDAQYLTSLSLSFQINALGVFLKQISGKAAPLALAIGARLEEFESSQQSLDLYCDVLKMWRTDTKVNASLETLGAWFEPSLSTKALEYTVKLKTRMGKCLCDMGEMEKGALGYRDAYLVSLRTQQFIMLVCYDYVFAPRRYIIPVYVSCFCKTNSSHSIFRYSKPFHVLSKLRKSS